MESKHLVTGSDYEKDLLHLVLDDDSPNAEHEREESYVREH